MKRFKKIPLALASTALFFALGLAACSQSDPEDLYSLSEGTSTAEAESSTSPIYTFPLGPDQMLIEGASASLTRTDNGVNYRFDTNSLEPGHAYTLWVVVFNEPGNCLNAPVCSGIDLTNPAVQPDLLTGTGRVASGSGTATFAGRVPVGDLSGSVHAPAGLLSYGLVNPYGASINLVIQHHGEVIPAFMPDMIHTLAGGCQDTGIPATGVPSALNNYMGSPEYAGEYGEAGPNECMRVQVSVLAP